MFVNSEATRSPTILCWSQSFGTPPLWNILFFEFSVGFGCDVSFLASCDQPQRCLSITPFIDIASSLLYQNSLFLSHWISRNVHAAPGVQKWCFQTDTSKEEEEKERFWSKKGRRRRRRGRSFYFYNTSAKAEVHPGSKGWAVRRHRFDDVSISPRWWWWFPTVSSSLIVSPSLLLLIFF